MIGGYGSQLVSPCGREVEGIRKWKGYGRWSGGGGGTVVYMHGTEDTVGGRGYGKWMRGGTVVYKHGMEDTVRWKGYGYQLIGGDESEG